MLDHSIDSHAKQNDERGFPVPCSLLCVHSTMITDPVF